MKYLLIIIIFFVSACNKKIYPKFDYNHSENSWVDAFKDRVFFTALKEAYKSDTSIFRLIEKKDAFNPYDGLSLNEIHEAVTLGINLIKNIPIPSMCENCSNGINYYMATALHYYKSKELDHIAKGLYKLHVKNDKNNGLLDK